MNEQKNEIVVYQPDETVRLDVRLHDDTVWLNRHQMAQLFARDVKTIGKHIANALVEELADGQVVAKFATTATDGKVYQVEYYNLDVVLSVGYRVKSSQGVMFRRWANTVLKEYLLRGYAVNSRLNQMDKRIMALEEKVDFFVQTSLPPMQGVFFDGQVFDADVFATKHILSARKSITLIDGWVSMETLEMLAKKRNGVKVEIVTERRPKLLAQSDIDKFNAQYGGLEVVYSGKFHDRFLIIDDQYLYLVGASLKDLGRKCFAFTRLDSAFIPILRAQWCAR